MGVYLLLFACWTLLLLLATGLVIRWYVRRAIREAQEVAHAFFDPGADNAPSQFALLVKHVSQVLATEVMLSVKGSLMGQASAVGKQIDAAASDIAGDALAAKSPWLAALLEFSPSLKKRVTKSPIAAMALANLNLGGLLKGQSTGGNGQSKASVQSTFELG